MVVSLLWMGRGQQSETEVGTCCRERQCWGAREDLKVLFWGPVLPVFPPLS